MTITKEQLADILDKHGKWLRSEGSGVRADLRGANLSGANLSSADLRSADLRGANLSGADLSSANLRGANLRGANLRSADLWGADLRGADLRSADLRSADLRVADLRSADLWGVDLRSAIIAEDVTLLATGRVSFQCGPTGSRDDVALFFNTNVGIYVRTGCFSGTLKEFNKALKETHGTNHHAKTYKAAIAAAKAALVRE